MHLFERIYALGRRGWATIRGFNLRRERYVGISTDYVTDALLGLVGWDSPRACLLRGGG